MTDDDAGQAEADRAIRAQIEKALDEIETARKDKKSKKKDKDDKPKDGKKNDLLKLIHEYQRRCIEFADRKATFIVFGANAFASFLDSSSALRGARDVAIANWTAKTWLGESAMLFLAAGGMTAIWVVVPHIRRNVPKGAIYWEAIRKHASADAWASDMSNLTESDTQQIVLRGIYDLAGINVSKYRTLQRATWLGGIGMALALLHMVI